MSALYQNQNQLVKQMVKLFISAFAVLFCLNVFASTDAMEHKEQSWPFEGVFGYFDKQSVQRGFQVYKEVCSSCHSLELVAFRNLKEVGLTKDEIKSLAAEYEVQDGPDDNGDMYTRAGKTFDKLPSPFPNDNAARAANSGALPPDLSLIIKARHDGANYLYSLLIGYNNTPPEGFELSEGMSYNPYFYGGQIMMPPPLSDGLIEYIDGKEATVDQMSRDVVNFLQWASEPEMEKRKAMGIKVLLYLIIFTVVCYFAYKSIWSDVK